MASGSSGARLAEDRRPDGGFRLRQSKAEDALWHLADREPEAVRRALRAQWADYRAYDPPKE